ncbi:MAG: hypothetical protein ACRDN6_04115 [Gaiellaceae bacterium]
MRSTGLLVGVLCALALLLSGAAGAKGTKSFTDATGDAGAGAADITVVVVSNDDNGLLTFAVTFANPALLSGENFAIIPINSDKNASTGRSGDGADYLIVFDGSAHAFARWNGAAFEPVTVTTLSRTGATTLSISNKDIGGSNAFDFYLVSFGPGEAVDLAPDGEAVWSYDLRFKPELEAVAARFSPAAPKAGKAFAVTRVSVGLATGETVQPSSYTCQARLAGRVLRPIGRCRWMVPANAKRKRLTVIITVTYEGVKEAFDPFAFRVR